MLIICSVFFRILVGLGLGELGPFAHMGHVDLGILTSEAYTSISRDPILGFQAFAYKNTWLVVF